MLRVGIGLGPGRAVRVYIHPDKAEKNPWNIVVGKMADGPDGKPKLTETAHKFPNRAEAEGFYHSIYNSAAVRNYPIKLTYFTFQKPSSRDGREVYVPDFDAIERHGPTPTDIMIVSTAPKMWSGNFQMWSATELKCHGDGIDAERVLSMGNPSDPLVQDAKERGSRYFPILGGCMTLGCPYYRDRLCKVGSSLSFQLVNYFRIGETAHFHTTGKKSTRWLFSSLHVIRAVVEMSTGRDDVRGIPMHMKVHPYTMTPEGKKASTGYAVRLALDEMELARLRQKLVSQSWSKPLQIASALAATVEAEPDVDEDEDIVSPVDARHIHGEFYSDGIVDADDDDDVVSTATTQASPTPVTATADDFKPAKDTAKKRGRPAMAGTTETQAPAAPVTITVTPTSEVPNGTSADDGPSETVKAIMGDQTASIPPTPEPTQPLPISTAFGPSGAQAPPPQLNKDDVKRANLLAQLHGIRIGLGDTEYTNRLFRISSSVTIESMQSFTVGQLESIHKRLQDMNGPAPAPSEQEPPPRRGLF